MDSEIIPDTEIQNVPLTQGQVKSKIKYSWVILFKYDVNESNPFEMARLGQFLNSDFPWKVIKEELSKEYRTIVHELAGFPSSKVLIFAKVEYG